jgi:hypothetical protein
LLSNSTVVAWGEDSYGQSDVPAGLSDVVAIGAGNDHSIALKRDGTVVGWGYQAFGSTNIPAGLANAAAIADGGEHSLAVQSNGTVVAWGWNGFGQTNVPPNLTNALAAAGGEAHSLALRRDGTLVGWGSNGHNQTNILSDLTNVMTFTAGAYHNLVITTNSWKALPPPRFITPTSGSFSANGGVVARARGLVGRGYILFYGSTNLSDWSFITLRSPSVGECLFTNSSATNMPWRFYRFKEAR